MNLPHCHIWISFHPTGYQEDVLMWKCVRCNKVRNEGVRSESGFIIPLGVSATTGRTLFGRKEDSDVAG